tara:strand:- start:321 stop:665 length:345 start_codon:yes stop_codon:yes gene_type:complete
MAYGESDNYTANITGPQPSNLITTGTGGTKSSTTVSAANPARKSITIQNQGTEPLYVKLGASATAPGSEEDWHFTLKAGTADYDGSGGVVDIDSYTGVITAEGTSKKYTYAEFV